LVLQKPYVDMTVKTEGRDDRVRKALLVQQNMPFFGVCCEYD